MNILIFGATGMVGQGVLRECLLAPDAFRRWPGKVTTTEQIGRAMLAAARGGAPKAVLDPADINALG